MPTRYLLQKLFRAVLTICIIVAFVFVALRMSGDAALQIYGADVDTEVLEALRKSWGLDKPIWKQYLIYIGNIFQGDMGKSYLDGRDAIEVVMERVPKTLSLMWITAIVTFLIGIPAGIYSALHHNTAIDRATMTLAVGGLSIPNFFLGVLLILLFSVTWRLLPSAGSESWQHYIMPVITMATAEASVFARFMRSSMLEVLSQPYIRTAMAKGVPWRKVIRGHALPNAAIPTDYRKRIRLARCRAAVGGFGGE
jgi:peptide/nickel transport system permease protein